METPPMTPPLPYARAIDVTELRFEFENDAVASLEVFKDYFSVIGNLGSSSLKMYRSDGGEVLKVYTAQEESEIISDALKRNIEYPIDAIESFVVSRVSIYGKCSVIIHGEAIDPTKMFVLELGEGAVVQFRDFDCETMQVHTEGGFYLGIGNCVSGGRDHAISFVPSSYKASYPTGIVDTSTSLDNLFFFTIDKENSHNKPPFSIEYAISKNMAFTVDDNNALRTTKTSSIPKREQYKIHDFCLEMRELFDAINPLPYVDPLKRPTTRFSQRLRKKNNRLASK